MGDPGDEQVILEDAKVETICSICGSKITGDTCEGCGLHVNEEEE